MHSNYDFVLLLPFATTGEEMNYSRALDFSFFRVA